jgi:hypothetical protein
MVRGLGVIALALLSVFTGLFSAEKTAKSSKFLPILLKKPGPLITETGSTVCGSLVKKVFTLSSSFKSTGFVLALTRSTFEGKGLYSDLCKVV